MNGINDLCIGLFFSFDGEKKREWKGCGRERERNPAIMEWRSSKRICSKKILFLFFRIDSHWFGSPSMNEKMEVEQTKSQHGETRFGLVDGMLSSQSTSICRRTWRCSATNRSFQQESFFFTEDRHFFFLSYWQLCRAIKTRIHCIWKKNSIIWTQLLPIAAVRYVISPSLITNISFSFVRV